MKGFETLRALVGDLQNQHGIVEVVYGVEPTASYHKPLAEYLIKNEDQVVYVSNVAVARNRAMLDGRWDKNDKKDAANVADLIGQGRCLYYDVPEQSLKDDLVLSIAQHCLDPREICAMEFDDFVKLVAARKITVPQQRRLRWLWEVSSRSAGCELHGAAKWEAQTIVRQLKSIIANLKDVEKQMEATAKTFPHYECLLSIPGFGPIVSAMVLAAIGTPSRFVNRKQLSALPEAARPAIPPKQLFRSRERPHYGMPWYRRQ